MRSDRGAPRSRARRALTPRRHRHRRFSTPVGSVGGARYLGIPPQHLAPETRRRSLPPVRPPEIARLAAPCRIRPRPFRGAHFATEARVEVKDASAPRVTCSGPSRKKRARAACLRSAGGAPRAAFWPSPEPARPESKPAPTGPEWEKRGSPFRKSECPSLAAVARAVNAQKEIRSSAGEWASSAQAGGCARSRASPFALCVMAATART